MLSRFKDKNKKPDAVETSTEATPQGSLLDLLGGAPAIHPGASEVLAFPRAQQNARDGSFLNELGDAESEIEKQRQAVMNEQMAEMSRLQAALAEYKSELHPAHAGQSTSTPGQSSRSQQAQLDLLAQELAAAKRQATARTAASSNEHRTGVAAPEQVFQPAGQQIPNQANSETARHVNPYSQQQAPLQFQRAINPFSFEKTVGALLRSWWLIFVFGLIGLVLATIYALSLPNKYQSVAEILIEPRGIKVLNESVLPSGLNSEATIAYAESQVRIITSSAVLDSVIDELELTEDPEFNGTSVTGGAVGRFLKLFFGEPKSGGEKMSAVKKYLYANLFVTRINQTFTIQVGVSTTDPAKSARIANAIASSYMDDESDAKSSAAKSANEGLSGRLNELRSRVRLAEEQVESYKAENGLVDADGKLVSELQLARLNEQLTLAQVQTGDARTRAKLAADADLGDIISGSLPSQLASPAVSQLRVEYNKSKSRLDKLATKLGSRHPERISGEAELRSARNAIAQEIKRIVQTAQQDYKRARARQADVQAQVNQLKTEAVTDSSAKVKLRELEREVSANRQIYESVLLRTRETGEQENISSKSARVISEAEPVEEKTGPNRKLIVATGGIGGGMLGALLGLIPFFVSGLKQVAFGTRENGPTGRAAPYEPQPSPTGDLYSSQEPAAYSPEHAAYEHSRQPAEHPAPNPVMQQPAAAPPPTAPQPAMAQPAAVPQQPTATAQPTMPQQPAPAYGVQMPLPGMMPQMVQQPAPQPMAQAPVPQAYAQPVYMQSPPMFVQQPVAQPAPQMQPNMYYTTWVSPEQK